MGSREVTSISRQTTGFNMEGDTGSQPDPLRFVHGRVTRFPIELYVVPGKMTRAPNHTTCGSYEGDRDVQAEDTVLGNATGMASAIVSATVTRLSP